MDDIIKFYLEKYKGLYTEVEVYKLSDNYYRSDIECGILKKAMSHGVLDCISEVAKPHDYAKVLYGDLFSPSDYVEKFDDCLDESYYEGDILVLVVEPEDSDGFFPEERIWEDIENGNFSDDILSEVCYSVSKRAKWYRTPGAALNSNYVPERKEAEERKDLQIHYYEMKEVILDRYSPIEIHYDGDFNKYYLYYDFGKHSFHRPIFDIEEWKNKLPIRNLDGFVSDTVDEYHVISERFCNFVLEKLTSLNEK